MKHAAGARLTYEPHVRRPGVERGAVIVRGVGGRGWYVVEHVRTGRRFTADEDELEAMAPERSEVQA